jgi:integrase/recombinase XerD
MKSLIAALPRVAQWRHARLPQCLSADEIELLLGAFDRTSATGKRDYAITRCLLSTVTTCAAYGAYSLSRRYP